MYVPRCLNVMKIIIDFEVALREAITDVIIKNPDKFRKDVEIHGCLFHYVQAIYRRFRSLINNPSSEQKTLLAIFLGFPYIEPNFVIQQFNLMKDLNYQPFESMVKYYSKYWIPRIPEFTLYNKSHSQVSTNNALESFHRDLNKTIPGAHPCFSASQDALFTTANRRYIEYEQRMLNGFARDHR
ncbi:hypothetical protein TRFO_27012 [Tritrichomonas foetus]|uniref:MULE transposase domain-containing protein n=1 Tax=Tritrichomonas foetus TaxID=1144522 RepID=A0A1J4K6D5_9EUKA|nr:hypothetical protein TRFO_27012 [Tritrichomonas foetus]|eukprot:OHT05268.1 hypothetical protein TRFO_27012 [Tritrichomonas foetus]